MRNRPRALTLALALLPAGAGAGMGSVDSVQAYPGDWPALDETPADCAAVQGDFVDPNRWRWAFEEFPGWPQGWKRDGTREATWESGRSPR